MSTNFELRLEYALAMLNVDRISEATITPQAAKGGPDPTKQDPALRKQQQDAERVGAGKVGASQATNQPGGQTGGGQTGGGQTPQDRKAQQDKQKQTQQSQQLANRMADLDKQVNQLQAKIQGGAAKPVDINKLNQLLTAKKSVQDQFMRLFGVNPSA